MSRIEFYSQEDYEHATSVLTDVLETKMNSGILNVPFDMLTASRRSVLSRIAFDLVSALARSDIAQDARFGGPVDGDIGDMPGVEIERITG